jgi:hypothetical protein
MDRRRFLQYIEAYNSGDCGALLPFYTADVVFENFGLRHEGAAAHQFLLRLRAGLQDKLKPLHVLIDRDTIAMEAEAEIHALVDLPQLPVGAMRAGEQCTVRMFAFYATDGDRIRHVRIAGWPAQR